MTWVRSDDNEPNHPKIFRAGAAGYGFFQAAKCYCSRNLTDGFIPIGDLSLILPSITFRAAVKLSILMVECGLFEKEETGYRVHDYLHYNPSKEQVLERRSERADSGRAGGVAKALARARASARPELEQPVCPVPSRPKKQILSPAGFADFWTAYPRKEGKGAAERAWRKLSPPIQFVLDAIRTQARPGGPLAAGKGDYIPHPATWLNARRWEDEVNGLKSEAPCGIDLH